MSKYYLKDGYTEKGPFSVDELKKLKISKTSFVRKDENTSWNQACDIQELRTLFSTNYRSIKKWLFLSIVLFVIGAYVVSNMNYSSTYYDDSYFEIEEQLPEPPQINFTVSKHEKKILKEMFKDCNLSGENKQLVKSCNYSNSTLRNFAVSVAGKSPGPYNLGQICDVFDHCYKNWKYVNDPKTKEVVEYASNTVLNGLNGDCDDFAVLICSMILSIGGEARINYAFGEEGGHAFTEVNIGKTDFEEYILKRYKNDYDIDGIWRRTDSDGNNWLNLDWFAGYPGGKYFNFKRGTSFYILQQYCNDFTN